jgi:hypothetical protein
MDVAYTLQKINNSTKRLKTDKSDNKSETKLKCKRISIQSRRRRVRQRVAVKCSITSEICQLEKERVARKHSLKYGRHSL